MIPYGRQSISEDDVEAVVAVLRSDWLTQGPAVARFEQAMAGYTGAQYGVAVCNATAALHLACLALGVSEGSRVWTSPNTFVASANCGRYCGAQLDFVDIEPETYNMSATALEAKLQDAERQGTLPDVVIPVHFAGQSCDMAAISGLSRQYGFKIIEDASHAVGADYLGKKVGSCLHSDITVFSFHPVKIITTGEGGMLMTNDGDLQRALLRLRSHGITRKAEEMAQQAEGAWYYEQQELGYNYRITDLQAALGASQLQRVDDFVARRRRLAARYDEQLARMAVIVPQQRPFGRSSYHLYPIRLDAARTSRNRREVFAVMREQGVGVNVHYFPVHLQPYYQRLGFRAGQFPEAERYYDSALSLPLFAALTDSQQDQVIETLKSALA